jgi:hypothetical protein
VSDAPFEPPASPTPPVAPAAASETEAAPVADVVDEEPLTLADVEPDFAPAAPVAPAPEPLAASDVAAPAPATHLRPVELVFDAVPGYQQASAVERALNDLLPDEDVDIVEFERGQLILSVQATDLHALALQLVAASPASLELGAVAGDRATFRCL